MLRKITSTAIYLLCPLSALNAGPIGGTLRDTSGTPVSGAIVTAYSQAKSQQGKFSSVYSSASQSDGSFRFDSLPVGSYLLCADQPEIALLNPCSWSTTRTTLSVTATGPAPDIALVAERGVALKVRINDALGLLSANPALDDVVIGFKPSIGPSMPARLLSRDSFGKTLTVLVRPGQAVDLFIYSAGLRLSDAKGILFGMANTKLTVVAPASSTNLNAATADVVINVLGKTQVTLGLH